MSNDNHHRPAVNGWSNELAQSVITPGSGATCPHVADVAAEAADRAACNGSASVDTSHHAGPTRVSSLPILPSESPLRQDCGGVGAGCLSEGNAADHGKLSTIYQSLEAFKANMQPWDDDLGKHARSVSEAPDSTVGETGRLVYGRSMTVKDPKEVEKRLERNTSNANRASRLTQLMDMVSKMSRKVTIRHDYRIDLDPAHEVLEEEGLTDAESEGESASGDDVDEDTSVKPKRLNIAILIVGTRGDVQPFIAIGLKLKEYGHRVRLASHSNYRDFITSSGLEFYPLGGDPKILAEYMVKNKGFLPRWPQEIGTQRKQLRAIINSLHDACICPDRDSGGKPFEANAIIANPPCIAHADVAEHLKVPLHVIFTMPWTATRAFPHPLAHVTSYSGFENWLSYAVVENVLWLGTRDLVTKFRKKLRLPKTPPKNKIPYAYIWSPSLAPKPKDWGKLVDVCGFCFLNLKRMYKPDEALEEWLDKGDRPIYIGFGSLPLENPGKMTDVIVKALAATNQRGIIQKGWGGLGDVSPAVEHVYTVGDCPHDWLFPKCKAVVHHGGAGTTAAGLGAGLPTTVVPFFGDQPFWGARVHELGVGPEPIPVNLFSEVQLVNAIKVMLDEKTIKAAAVLAEKMSHEDGVQGVVGAFYRHFSRSVPAEKVGEVVKLRKGLYKRLMCFGGASD